MDIEHLYNQSPSLKDDKYETFNLKFGSKNREDLTPKSDEISEVGSNHAYNLQSSSGG